MTACPQEEIDQESIHRKVSLSGFSASEGVYFMAEKLQTLHVQTAFRSVRDYAVATVGIMLPWMATPHLPHANRKEDTDPFGSSYRRENA
jgi:hypothetical protein